MSNIVESFATFLDSQAVATMGTDLFIGDAPSSDFVPDAIWWLKANGGTQERSVSGESIKTYQVQAFYRNRDAQAVYDKMFNLENLLSCASCADLPGFDVVDIRTVAFPADQDLDQEDRMVGLLQANIQVYAAC
jgi:hypothetical protein